MKSSYEIISVVALTFVGLLFFLSYFLAEKNAFFEYLAYFPRKREKSVKIGGLIFGRALWVVAILHIIRFF